MSEGMLFRILKGVAMFVVIGCCLVALLMGTCFLLFALKA